LDPFYTHYIHLIYQHRKKTVINIFADDTAIVAKDSDPTTASRILQDHITGIEKWLQKWRIKVNQNKSTHITFTNHKGQCPSISINQTSIPQGSTVKYLGLHLDSKLTWRKHITKKRKQLDLKTREINWLNFRFMVPYFVMITLNKNANQMYFVLKIIKISFTLFRSTCFGQHCAHHQELLSCTCSLWSCVVLGSLCPPFLLCCNCCYMFRTPLCPSSGASQLHMQSLVPCGAWFVVSSSPAVL